MSKKEDLDKFEQLIHDIIFGTDIKIKINILDYIDDLIYYEEFIKKVTDVLKRSGIDLHDEEVNLKKNDIIWTFVAKK
jgi:hypothetical protein